MKNLSAYWPAILLALILLSGFLWWGWHDPTADLQPAVPGMDGAPAHLAASIDAVSIGQYFDLFAAMTNEQAGNWPRFRGLQLDNIVKEKIKLVESWGAQGPPQLWSIELGEGHAAAAVHQGRVYVLDYDETRLADALRCFSLADGRELWRRWYQTPMKRNHGLSRTIPAVTDDYVITIGPRCHVMCTASKTGKLHWGLDLVKDYGAKEPLWYTGQCPLIDDTIAVIAPGGQALLMGVGLAGGQVVWQTPNPRQWEMSHSSVMIMNFGGRRMYVYSAVGGVAGVAADGADRGRILWECSAWNHAVVAPSPVILPDGRIFLTAGYGAGSMMIRIVKNESGFSSAVLQTVKPAEGLASEQQTPIYYQGLLFAIMPKDGGAYKNQFVCCRPDDLTRFVWTSGKTERFGLGPFLLVDQKFLILSDEGELTMIRAASNGYYPLAKAKILEGPDAWGPLALAGTRLLARDAKKLVCVDLAK
jgi:outer membrane protein assembly factor BamB